MIKVPLMPFRGRKRKVAQQPPAPAALTLLSASYDQTAKTLTMQFDRAIDVSAFDGEEVLVYDGTFNHHTYVASGTITMIDPATMRVGLFSIIADSDPGVNLTAASDNRIKAVDDGGTWSGTEGTALPFAS